MIRKQVQTNEAGPGKLKIKARGPYRVLEEIKLGTYWIQRIPFLKDNGKPGKRLKESATRMERIPTTVVVHKIAQGADSSYATLNRPYIPNPVEQTFGPHQFGVYRPPLKARPFAFEQIENIWGVEEDIDTTTIEQDTAPRESEDEIILETNNTQANAETNPDSHMDSNITPTARVNEETINVENDSFSNQPGDQQPVDQQPEDQQIIPVSSRKVCWRNEGILPENLPTRRSKRAQKIPQQLKQYMGVPKLRPQTVEQQAFALQERITCSTDSLRILRTQTVLQPYHV